MFEDVEIINMIKAEKTIDEMAKELDVSLDEIHRRIMSVKNSGYNLNKIVYDNGKIRYCLRKNPENSVCTLKLKLTDRYKFSAMLISDLHFGNVLARMDYLKEVYKYCQKYCIHIVINGGDLIDGDFSKGEQNISDPILQLEHVIKNYPTSDNILNLICLGNHDYSLFKYGIDVKKALENARYDLIPFGYGLGILSLESDQIFIRHSISELSFEPINKKLVLEGHRHKAAFTSEGNGFLVNIPTLSDLVLGKHEFPGVIRMDLFLNNDGYIESGHFEQFVVSDKLQTVNESVFKFDLDRDPLSEDIVRPKVRCKEINGQIDKFKRKWRC